MNIFHLPVIYIICFIPGCTSSLGKLTSPGAMVVSFHVLHAVTLCSFKSQFL